MRNFLGVGVCLRFGFGDVILGDVFLGGMMKTILRGMPENKAVLLCRKASVLGIITGVSLVGSCIMFYLLVWGADRLVLRESGYFVSGLFFVVHVFAITAFVLKNLCDEADA